jgi:hypothetical protein
MGFAILGVARATLASMAGPGNLVSIFEGGLSARMLTKPIGANTIPSTRTKSIVTMPKTNPFIAFSCIPPPVPVDSPEEDAPDYLL